MRQATIFLFIVTMFHSCSTKDTRTKTDTIFGLELGMKVNDANKLLESTFKKDSGSYYFNDQQVTHFRGTEDRKIEINFYRPEFRDSVLVDYSYTLQVITIDEEYVKEFHKQILDELQAQHGNAKNVDFKSDNESVLTWDLGDKAILEMRIDKEDNVYSLNYRLSGDQN
jgi:hypothetical protein